MERRFFFRAPYHTPARRIPTPLIDAIMAQALAQERKKEQEEQARNQQSGPAAKEASESECA